MRIPYIFNIQRYSIHDGPGIRTTIFVKGCSLKCIWCCNPESQSFDPEVYFENNQCIGCLSCEKVCREKVLLPYRLSPASPCRLCKTMECVDVCPSGAISIMGEKKSIQELVSIAERDISFYRQHENGGVTVSGGEPLLFPDFLKELLLAFHEKRITTAVETSLHVPWKCAENLIDEIDYWYCDYKHWDSSKFKQWTGGNLKLIEDNLQQLSKYNMDVTIRIPLIPGFNDSKKDIHYICKKIESFGFHKAELMPYHRLGMVKYEQLGREYMLKDTSLLDKNFVEELNHIPKEYGLSR